MTTKTLLDGLAGGRMTRRELNKVLAAAGLGIVTLPLMRAPAQAEENVTFFTWAGYELPEFVPAYIDKHGGPPNYTLFGEEEEALQKMRAGFTPDIAHPCVNSVSRWRDAGIIEPIDMSRLKNWPNVWENLQAIEGTVFNGENWFMPWDWGNSSILYRTDLVDPEYAEEETWSILLDERYKGRMAIYDSVDAIAAITGLLTGAVDPFNMTDAELVEARKVLKQIHDNLRFWWTDQTSIEQALASGELVAAYAWNSAVVNLKAEGLPVAYMNPKEGILTWVCGLVRVVNGPGSEDRAYDMLDAMLDPESGRYLIDAYGYGHSNRKSFDLVSKDRLTELGISNPEALFAQGVFFDQIDPSIREKLITMFEEIKAGA
jgi:spermidine/putrescine-binding protein